MATRTKTKVDVHQIVADRFLITLERILEAMENETGKWNRPWITLGNGHGNLSSKKPYRGINPFLCEISAMNNGFTSRWWLSFKQAREMAVSAARAEGRDIVEKVGRNKSVYFVENIGGQEMPFVGGVRKGEKGTLITFRKKIEVADANEPDGKKKLFLLRYYYVFNTDQIDGIDSKIPTVEVREFKPHEAAQAIVDGFENPPDISHGSDRAYYRPRKDSVTMPHPEAFKDSDSYYCTLLHELAHSTGHPSRLNRPGVADFDRFGSEQYSEEELVAEFAAAMLCGEAGIDSTIPQSAAYLRGWLDKLTANPKWVVKAAGAAQKAADHILGVKWENDTESEEK